MREHESQPENLAQARRDDNSLGGAGGLVNSAHDGLHHYLRSERLGAHSIGHYSRLRYRW